LAGILSEEAERGGRSGPKVHEAGEASGTLELDTSATGASKLGVFGFWTAPFYGG